MAKYIPIIGLEIHVELKTNSKMFCSCPNRPDRDPPNTNICEICLAHPGTLPVPNRQAIIDTVKISKALRCSIAKQSKFDRKHYFYPDLPKGYQISQLDEPIGENGSIFLDLQTTDNLRPTPKIKITRVHLEEDTAKLIHTAIEKKDNKNNSSENNIRQDTLIDFNRAGVPLVEIVSEPDIKSAIEAKAYCQEIQMIIKYLQVSDADMDKGHMRCEANISVQEEGKFEIIDGIVRPIDNYILNPKIELKNLNSFKVVEKSINYEIKRQTTLIEAGETWIQQTRGWNDSKGESFMQREKETSADYRYFPEPDIPPFEPEEIAGDISLPELPSSRRIRLNEEYGFSFSDANILTSNRYLGNFAENTMSELIEWLQSLPESKKEIEKLTNQKQKELARLAGGWITSKLLGAISERKIDIRILKVKPENFAELIALVYTKRVNSTNAQKILIEMIESGVDKDPTHIMEEKGYGQIDDEDKIGNIIDDIITSYPKQIEEFKSGKEPVLRFLVGMVMRASEGSADPTVVEKLLREKL